MGGGGKMGEWLEKEWMRWGSAIEWSGRFQIRGSWYRSGIGEKFGAAESGNGQYSVEVKGTVAVLVEKGL